MASSPEQIEYIIYIDDDDKKTINIYNEMKQDEELGSQTTAIIGTRLDRISSCQEECYKISNNDIIGFVADDLEFNTYGWDDIVRDAFEKSEDKILLVYGSDGHKNKSMATAAFFHRTWIDVVGYAYPPYFKVGECDKWITEVAKGIGRDLYIPELLITHLFRETEGDKTNVKRRKFRQRMKRKYRSGNMTKARNEDIRKLKQYIKDTDRSKGYMRNAKKVFITGITGFVGSHLADYLLEETDVKIYGLTRWRSPKENVLHLVDNDRIIFEHGDLTDFSSLYRIIERVKPDCIFHLAAQSYVPYSFDAPLATLDSNIMGTCNLLEVIKVLRHGEDDYDPTIHICSSSEVYGQVGEDDIPIKEDCPFRPASPYAVSKVGEDMLGFQYWTSFGIKTIRTRMFTHTGPKRGDVFVVAAFAKQIAKIEAGLQEPIIRVGNLDSIRTFADVRDTVRAYWLLVNKCEPGEVYNIGGNVTMTIRDMLQKLISFSTYAPHDMGGNQGIKIEVDPSLLRPSDVTLQIPCIDKFQKVTGWKPEIDFNVTLKDTLDFWREYWRKNG